MNRLLKIIFVAIIIVASLSLSGCFNNVEEEPKLVVSECIKDSKFEKSEKGKTLLYYYATPTEVSLYYCNGWKGGKISCKKYFLNKDTYEIEKNLVKADKTSDKELTIYIKEYQVVNNMDAYWDEIEASSIYTIVK